LTHGEREEIPRLQLSFPKQRPTAGLRQRERERRVTRLDLTARVRNVGRRQHRNRGSKGARFGAQRRRLRAGLHPARRERLQPHRTDVLDDYFKRRFVGHLVVTGGNMSRRKIAEPSDNLSLVVG
jgi:hypothetical protein